MNEQAQQEGRIAWERGLLISDNPYAEWSDPDSPWSQWRLGYEAAEAAAKGDNHAGSV